MTESDIRNITVELPASELEKAMYSVDAAVQGALVLLEAMSRNHAYQAFAEAYGSLKDIDLEIDLDALREDSAE